MVSTLDSFKLPTEEKALFKPHLEEIAEALTSGLKNNFNMVSVGVIECPDLSSEPFNLASRGLGGDTKLIEVGGPPFLLPLHKSDKVYDLKTLVKRVGLETGFVLGAGAGPWPYVGKNCEMMTNIKFNETSTINKSHIAKLDPNEEEARVEILPSDEHRFALMANLFCCQGEPSKVIKVVCGERTGEDNFITAIRNSLKEKFHSSPVGLGGAFLLKSGKAKIHIMPSFSETALDSDDDLNKWLRFFEFSAPLVNVGTLVSCDIPGLDLRLQHFHCFSIQGEGGHYHYDVTPKEVLYEGYFNVADSIYRIDKPQDGHAYGRD